MVHQQILNFNWTIERELNWIQEKLCCFWYVLVPTSTTTTTKRRINSLIIDLLNSCVILPFRYGKVRRAILHRQSVWPSRCRNSSGTNFQDLPWQAQIKFQLWRLLNFSSAMSLWLFINNIFLLNMVSKSVLCKLRRRDLIAITFFILFFFLCHRRHTSLGNSVLFWIFSFVNT